MAAVVVVAAAVVAARFAALAVRAPERVAVQVLAAAPAAESPVAFPRVAAGALPRAVEVTPTEGAPPIATIRCVLPRRSAFRRKVAGDVTTAQIVAANVDVALIAAALPGDVNPRRIEGVLLLG